MFRKSGETWVTHITSVTGLAVGLVVSCFMRP